MASPYHIDIVRHVYGDRPMMECQRPLKKPKQTVYYPIVRPDLYDSLPYRERMKNPVFTREQVEHAVKVAPRIKGVFEKAYQAPTVLSHYKVIANIEIALTNFETKDAIKLERLGVAEAALDIYDFLKESKC